jgi:hypothetical protein
MGEIDGLAEPKTTASPVTADPIHVAKNGRLIPATVEFNRASRGVSIAQSSPVRMPGVMAFRDGG